MSGRPRCWARRSGCASAGSTGRRWRCVECAKPWPEADADVCEAIDFLKGTAGGAVELAAGKPLLQIPGERNELAYRRGVVAVISPWNFPLAIPWRDDRGRAGRRQRGRAQDRPEQSPACAHRLVQALRAGGVPQDAISLLPGEGDIGAALVRDPGVETIAFTGSLEVGLKIVRAAGVTAPGQRHLKRVIAELGGKNSVVVDADADLDEAVPAIVSSAFAYAGQKCSAASRVLVHEAIADQPDRPRRRGGAGPERGPGKPAGDGRAAGDRADRAGASAALRGAGRAPGRIAAEAETVPGPGWFCAPAVAVDLDPDSPVSTRRSSDRAGDRARARRGARLRHRRQPAVRADRGPVRLVFRTTVRYVRERSPVGNLYVEPGDQRGDGGPRSRSAATVCRARAAKPADRITCSSSSSRGS